MKIGILGAGMIGGTLAERFVRAGHDVMISNTRPASLLGLVDGIGGNIQAGYAAQAATFGEVILLAVPYRASRGLAAELFTGKIVIDAMNRFPDRDGGGDPNGLSSSEAVALRLPGARLVKAFNTLHYTVLGHAVGGAVALMIAGDDIEAKTTVAGLARDAGLTPVDNGTLAHGGRRQEPGSPLFGAAVDAGTLRQLLAAFDEFNT